MNTVRALIIRSPHIEKILAGKKTWEIRGTRTSVRGFICLIRGGSGQIVGTCEITECKGPLTPDEFRRSARKAGLHPTEARSGYRRTYAWVLSKARPLRREVPYVHPSGAVIWVKIDQRTLRAVKRSS